MHGYPLDSRAPGRSTDAYFGIGYLVVFYGLWNGAEKLRWAWLKPEYTEILRRVVLDGAPLPGVAAELGLTTNNASVRLHRARAALRKRMAEHCGTLRARSCTECGCAERGCCVD